MNDLTKIIINLTEFFDYEDLDSFVEETRYYEPNIKVPLDWLYEVVKEDLRHDNLKRIDFYTTVYKRYYD